MCLFDTLRFGLAEGCAKFHVSGYTKILWNILQWRLQTGPLYESLVSLVKVKFHYTSGGLVTRLRILLASRSSYPGIQHLVSKEKEAAISKLVENGEIFRQRTSLGKRIEVIKKHWIALLTNIIYYLKLLANISKFFIIYVIYHGSIRNSIIYYISCILPSSVVFPTHYTINLLLHFFALRILNEIVYD